MRNELKKLRELIDNQDAVALRAFLIENESLGLNNITASGCSALWYALTVPKNKKPSLAIIQTLIDTGRINPTETYQKLRYNQLSLPVPIARAIKTYEDQYQHPQRAGQAEDNDQNHLANVAANAQNTHDSIVVKGVDDSISRLVKRYRLTDAVINQSINQSINQLTTFINTLKNKTEINIDLKNLNDALSAINRINRDHTTRDYKLSEDQTIAITNSAVLALMFRAASDKDPGSFVSGAEMTDAEILQRKLQLIKHLAKSQNEYGDNSAACWMGTRNQMVSSLDMTHIDIRVLEEASLSASIIAMKYRAFCQKKLENLEEKNSLYFEKYLRYYALRDLPGVGKFEGENTDIPSDIKQFVQSIQKEFSDMISEENSNMKKSLDGSELEKIFANLFQDATYSEENNLHYALNDTGHRAINEFRKLAEISTFSKENTSITYLIPQNKFQELRRISGENLAEKVTLLKQSLINEVNIDKLYEYITSHPVKLDPANPKNWDEYQKKSLYSAIEIYKSLLDSVDISKKHEILKEIWPKMLETLITEADLNPSEQVLWSAIQDHLQKLMPDISDWLKLLPNEEHIVFLRKLFDKKLLPDFFNNKEAIKEEALTSALDTGFFKGLNFQQPVTLKDKDLRGKDFGSVNLSNIVFENCDLQLTNIENNPTLSEENLKNNTFSMPSTLYSVLKIPKRVEDKINPTLLKAFLDNPRITGRECIAHIEKLKDVIFAKIHPDPLAIRILAEHEKTQLLFSNRLYRSNFINTMCYNAECFDAGLASPYYETKDAIRTLKAGIEELLALNYRFDERLSAIKEWDRRDLSLENNKMNIEAAIKKIKEKLRNLGDCTDYTDYKNHKNYADYQFIKKSFSELLSPAEIYNAIICFCKPEIINTSQHENENYSVYAVLNDQGEEVGRLIYPRALDDKLPPHIVYFPGAVENKYSEACGVPLLSDVKKFVDKKLIEDYPELDFSQAIGHYTLAVGENHYVAGVSQNGHLNIQGYSLQDKIRSYDAFQKAVGCTERSYTSCNDKEITLKTKNPVLSSHRYLISTNHDNRGFPKKTDYRRNDAHFSAEKSFYPDVKTRVRIYSDKVCDFIQHDGLYIEKKLPKYPNANSFNQAEVLGRINNLTYEDSLEILENSKDRNLVKRIISQLADDIPKSEITSGEKIEQLEQIYKITEHSSVLRTEQGLLGKGLFSKTGNTVSYSESMKKIQLAILNVLETCSVGDLSKGDVERAKAVLSQKYSRRVHSLLNTAFTSSVHLKKHEDHLSDEFKM